MITPSRCYWEVCGSPVVDVVDEYVNPPAKKGKEKPPARVVTGCCGICGGDLGGRGIPLDEAGMTFCNQTNLRAPSSGIVCEPCVFSTRWICPPGRSAKTKEDGSEGRGPNPSMYGHRWHQRADGSIEYGNHSKGDKPALRDFLRAPKSGPWWCTVSDSGKKHTIPWAPLNAAGTRRPRVLFDELLVTVGDWQLVDDVTALLTAGATKESIERGEYNVGEWERCPEVIQAFEAKWSHERGGGWLMLAVWMGQRDEAIVAERQAREKEDAARKKAERKAQDTARRVPAGRAKTVRPNKRVQSVGAVEPTVKPNAIGGPDIGDSGPVVHEPDAEPANRSAGQGQLGLFAGAEPLGGGDGRAPANDGADRDRVRSHGSDGKKDSGRKKRGV